MLLGMYRMSALMAYIREDMLFCLICDTARHSQGACAHILILWPVMEENTS